MGKIYFEILNFNFIYDYFILSFLKKNLNKKIVNNLFKFLFLIKR